MPSSQINKSATLLLVLNSCLIALTHSACAQIDPHEYVRELDQKCANQSSSESIDKNYLSIVKRYAKQSESCERERAGWRWMYVQELGTWYDWHEAKSRVLVMDKSLDARLANLVYTAFSANQGLVDVHRFNCGDSKQDDVNIQQVAGSSVSDDLCSQQLTQMLALSEDLERRVDEARRSDDGRGRVVINGLNSSHVHLARVLDSFGRYESRFLSGKMYAHGSYEQCISAQLELPSRESGQQVSLVPTRYCWARFSLERDRDEFIKSDSSFDDDPAIKAAVCLPRSCHSKSFRNHSKLFQQLIGSQFKLPPQLFARQQLELKSIFCQPDTDSPANELSFSAWLLICLLTIWLALISLASLFHLKSDKNSFVMLKLCQHLSLQQSWKSFSNHNKARNSADSNSVDLGALNLIRWLLCSFLVVGHSAIISMWHDGSSLQTLRDLEPGPLMDVFNFGLTCVYAFMIITGFITAFSLSKKLSVRYKSSAEPCLSKWQFITISLRLVALRAAHLLPVYYLLFWFKKSIHAHLSQGPMWDFGLNSETFVGVCRHQASWWSPLMFNYDSDSTFKHCLPQSWYIGADIAIYLVSAPLVLAYFFRPKLASSLGALILLLSFMAQSLQLNRVLTPAVLWELNSSGSQISTILVTALTGLAIKPEACVLFNFMGVCAGVALHKSQAVKSKRVDKSSFAKLATLEQQANGWPQAQHVRRNTVLWPAYFRLVSGLVLPVLSILLLLLASFRRVIQNEIMRRREGETWFLDAPTILLVTQLTLCLTITLLLMRVVTDWKSNKLLQTFSKSPFWQQISQLSFLVYLLHCEFLLLYPQLQTSLFLFSRWQTVYLAAAAYFLSIFAALIVQITFLIPMNSLLSTFIGRPL